jgi:hypothetical protein
MAMDSFACLMSNERPSLVNPGQPKHGSPFHGADELASGSQWTLVGGMNSAETNSHRHTNDSI